MFRALARDPLVIKRTRIDTIWASSTRWTPPLPRLRAPLLLSCGARHEIIPKRPIRRFVRSLPHDPADRRSLAYIEHGRHMLMRDLDGPVVIADVAGRVLAAGAPLFSGADHGAPEAALGGTNQASLGKR